MAKVRAFTPNQVQRQTRRILEEYYYELLQKEAVTQTSRFPPIAMTRAATRGLRLVERGFGGKGLEYATIRQARKIADGQPVSEQWIRKAYRYFRRNRRFAEFDAETPAGVSWLLWGGSPGERWVLRQRELLRG